VRSRNRPRGVACDRGSGAQPGGLTVARKSRATIGPSRSTKTRNGLSKSQQRGHLIGSARRNPCGFTWNRGEAAFGRASWGHVASLGSGSPAGSRVRRVPSDGRQMGEARTLSRPGRCRPRWLLERSRRRDEVGAARGAIRCRPAGGWFADQRLTAAAVPDGGDRVRRARSPAVGREPAVVQPPSVDVTNPTTRGCPRVATGGPTPEEPSTRGVSCVRPPSSDRIARSIRGPVSRETRGCAVSRCTTRSKEQSNAGRVG
jgi:hypothetical protein